jgi:hypothetical protein
MFSLLELAPDLTMDSFTHLGRLELSQGTLIDASGNGDGTVLSRVAICWSTDRRFLRITRDQRMAAASVWTCA